MADSQDKKYNISELAEKWLTGTITEEEKAYFEDWYSGFNDEELKFVSSRHSDATSLRQHMLQNIHSRISDESSFGKVRSIKYLYRIAAAASVLLILSVGGYLLFHRRIPSPAPVAQQPVHDVAPGGNRAVLTLSNGKTVILDSVSNGQIAVQGNNNVMKVNSGMLAYNASGASSNQGGENETVYNTLTTPRGGQYQLVLSDGTKVWLNAASSIRYPIGFTGKERVVTITGEAYFEVKHNSRMPFKVIAGNEVIEDLGTHFDVMAYNDEASLNTTLLSGAIAINYKDRELKLQPGEQAILNKAGKIHIQPADTLQVVAWMHGQLDLRHVDVAELMRQISRWYNVDVVFRGAIPERSLSGLMDRNVYLSNVMAALEANGIECKLVNHQLIVSAK